MKFGAKEWVCLLVIIIGLIVSFPGGKASSGGRIKRVQNGIDAKYGEYPYTARLRRWKYPICTGVLISELAGLTAQHCIPERNYVEGKNISGKPYDLVLGIVEEGQPETIAKVKDVRIPETKYQDIAILNFEKPVELSENIKPAALSKKPLFYKEDTLVDYSGWGASNKPVKRLQYHRMELLQDKWCGLNYGDDISIPFRICTARMVDGICSRPGDSGGPLVIKRPEGDVLVGILSGVVGSCWKGFAEVFDSVSWNADWISRYAKGNLTFVEVTDT